MRSMLSRIPVIALLLAAIGSLAGCIVAPPRHAHDRERVTPVRAVHARVWVPGYWVPHHGWVEGRWRYR